MVPVNVAAYSGRPTTTLICSVSASNSQNLGKLAIVAIVVVVVKGALNNIWSTLQHQGIRHIDAVLKEHIRYAMSY
jgi:hypothetical protein